MFYDFISNIPTTATLKNWYCNIINVTLDKEILEIGHQIIILCEKYVKVSSGTKFDINSREVDRRKKILSEIKFIPSNVREILQCKLPPVIFLYKAAEELFLHGLRSCQGFLTDVNYSSRIKEILDHNEFLSLTTSLEKLIGPYSEKFASLSDFLNGFFEKDINDHRVCSHSKFQHLEDILKSHFEQYGGVKAIILCQSTFCKLEICSFLSKSLPLIKPMIYLSQKTERNGSSKEIFSEEAKDAVKKMFENGQLNVLVTSFTDLKELNIGTADYIICFDPERQFKEELFRITKEGLYLQQLVIFSKRSFERVFQQSTQSSQFKSIGKKGISKANQYLGVNRKKIMDCKFHSNIFESGFESFEFDDGFLSKVDAEIKSNGKKLEDSKESTTGTENNSSRKDEKIVDKNKEYYNLPIDIEDFNDSNFFDSKLDEKIFKVKKETDSLNNAFIAGLSPIQGSASSKGLNRSFSSTPLRKESVKSERKASEKNCLNKEGQPASEVVLEGNLKEEDQDNFITLSQAFEIIEEESSKETKDQVEPLNKSIDLLTGEIVGDVGDLFAESFNVSKLGSVKSKRDKILVVEETVCESSDASVIESDSEIAIKPAAAQKLNFGTEPVDFKKESSDLQNICFDSDDDFEVLTQVCAAAETVSSPSPVFTRTKKSEPLNDSSVLELSVDSIDLDNKKGKRFRVIESDSESEGRSPEYLSQWRKKSKKQNDGVQGRQYLDSEAEVSDEIEVSSDEVEEDGEYDRSFLDEGSYLTQNQSANMTAKYLESVKSVSARPGAFKIPKAKPYIPANVFSQIPEDNNTDYELDSFCVNEVDEEMKTDLSDLEIAEKILEMDRKKRKKKRGQPSKRAK